MTDLNNNLISSAQSEPDDTGKVTTATAKPMGFWNGILSSPFKSSSKSIKNESVKPLSLSPTAAPSSSGIPVLSPSSSAPQNSTLTSGPSLDQIDSLPANTAVPSTIPQQQPSLSFANSSISPQGVLFSSTSPSRRLGLGMLSQHHQSAAPVESTANLKSTLFSSASSPNPSLAVPKPAEDYTNDKVAATASTSTISSSLSENLKGLGFGNDDADDLSKVEFENLLDDEEPLPLADMDTELDLMMESEPLAPNQTNSSHSTADSDLQSTPSKNTPVDLFSSLDLNEMMPSRPLIQISTPKVSSSTTTAPTHTQAQLSEFDPLIPKDWMMSFDSPAPLHKSDSISSLPAKTTAAPHSKTSTPSAAVKKMAGVGGDVVSLLDNFDPATPKSTLLYSQKDMDALKQSLQEKFDKELSLSTQELSDLSNQATTLLSENSKIKQTLAEWERAVTKMLADRDLEKQEAKARESKLLADLDQERSETALLRKEIETVNIKWKQLRIDHSDLQEETTSLKTKEKSLTADLETAHAAFQTLKQHAEQKLSHANIEIARVRAAFEKDVLSLKTKSGRLEASLNTAKQALDAKGRECDELVRICDALEKQLALD